MSDVDFAALPVAFLGALPRAWEALLRVRAAPAQQLVWTSCRAFYGQLVADSVPVWSPLELEALALAVEHDAADERDFFGWCGKKARAGGYRLTLVDAFGHAWGLRPVLEVAGAREYGSRVRPTYRVEARCGRSLVPALTVGQLAGRVGCEVVAVRCVERAADGGAEFDHGTMGGSRRRAA